MARLSRMMTRMQAPRGAALTALAEELGVSLATVRRDLAYLRDQLRMPAEYCATARRWKVPPDTPFEEQRLPLPGLWLDPRDIYALLTLQNLSNKLFGLSIAPLRTELRGLLKTLLIRQKFPMRGVDRKIDVRLPGATDLRPEVIEPVLDALFLDRPVRVRLTTGQCTVVPQRLCLEPGGWVLECALDGGRTERLPLAAIVSAAFVGKGAGVDRTVGMP